MKTIIMILAISVFMMNSCNGNSKLSNSEIVKINQDLEIAIKSISLSDTMLINIQQKIMNAFIEAKIGGSDNELISLEQNLLDMNVKKPNSIIIYWYAYACYYHSILFLTENNNKKSEEILKKGIDQLDKLNPKSSEQYALLALMQSISIQFVAGIKAPFISKQAHQNVEKALQLDSLNLRAYYVLGSSDFYTPEQYGGGKMTDTYMLKAISLKDQSVVNPYLPSWGRNSAYEILIRHYIKKQKWELAKKYYTEAVALFPDDFMINKLAGELVNH